MQGSKETLKALEDSVKKVSEELSKHEHEDIKNMEYVKKHIHECTHEHKHTYEANEGTKMGMDNLSDKVNINLGDGGRGGDSGAMAALVAALGNRNQGDNSAALIAALGNRNHSNELAPLMAMMANKDRGHDNGLGEMWPLLLLLMGRGNNGGGLFGGGDGNGNAGIATGINALEGIAELRAAIPTVALENQNAIQHAISQLALAGQQGFSNTKDAVQNTLLALSQSLATVNQNVSSQGCQTREYVSNDGDKTRALLVTRFGQEDATKIAEQNARIVALETRSDNDRRFAETNLTISNNNTAVAAQAQGQQQQQQQQLIGLVGSLVPTVNALIGDIQAVKQGQVIFNSGTMAASGTQASANTKVA